MRIKLKKVIGRKRKVCYLGYDITVDNSGAVIFRTPQTKIHQIKNKLSQLLKGGGDVLSLHVKLCQSLNGYYGSMAILGNEEAVLKIHDFVNKLWAKCLSNLPCESIEYSLPLPVFRSLSDIGEEPIG